MKQVIHRKRGGQAEILEVPDPQCTPRAVRIRTLVSLISSGTERNSLELAGKSLIGKAQSRPDLVKKVLGAVRTEGVLSTVRTVRNRLEEAVPLGYSLAGVVEEVGQEVTGIKPGDLVAAAGAGFANHAEVVVAPHLLISPVPPSVSAEEAAFTTLGAIALQGVRQAGPLLGETFLVIGLGLIGQLVIQLLRANGCRVLATDLNAGLLERVKAYGVVGLASDSSLTKQVLAVTSGFGVDGVIIAASTANSDPVETAGLVTREKGRVVVIGDVGMTLQREPYYMKELDFRLSRSYGPGRYDRSYEENGNDYPYGYVRFTERRNMEAFLDLVAEKRVEVASLITHRFSIDDALQAYEVISRKDEPHIGVLLLYDRAKAPRTRIELAPKAPLATTAFVSLIGAGNYATAKLLPILRSDSRVTLNGVCTSSGLSARDVGERFGFAFCTSSIEDVLTDPTTAVFIATRHDTHAALAARCLDRGKHVFVEKPLCLTRDDLRQVSEVAAGSPGQLLVGYNRRYSPLTRTVSDFLGDAGAPTVISIRVNAGSIDRNHWIMDPQVGGGRILGEACHFVDLAIALSRSMPVRVHAFAGAQTTSSPILADSVAITITMENGSLASIVYVACGGSRMTKERIEAFRSGRSAVIDDFRNATLYSGSADRIVRLKSQDKGQKDMLNAFFGSLEQREPVVPLSELIAVSDATLGVIESLAQSREIDVGGWRDFVGPSEP